MTVFKKMSWIVMKVSEIISKMIIDSAGNEIGKTDDLEVDWKGGTMDALVVKGKGSLSERFDSEYAASLLRKLKLTKSDDLLIPTGDIQSIGKYIALKKSLKASLG